MIYKIDEFESGQRLDKWIKRKFQKIPQSFIEKLSRKGKIKLNEKKTKLSYKIREGDVVELPFIEINKKKKKINTKDFKKLKKEIKKKIIHKDKEKIIIDKPPGISVHKGSKVFLSIDDIRSSLRFSLKEDPRIVHRIDKETSGLLMLARTYKSSVFLSEQFKKRKIKKFYIAILNGVPKKKEGSILDDIKDKTKKKALTKYFLMRKINKKFSLMLLLPETGRKRQLREHCYQLGYPILGDKKYFKKIDKINNFDTDKLFLHAYKLEFFVNNGNYERYVAPIPNHFKKFFILNKISLSEKFINKFIITKILKGEKN